MRYHPYRHEYSIEDYRLEWKNGDGFGELSLGYL